MTGWRAFRGCLGSRTSSSRAGSPTKASHTWKGCDAVPCQPGQPARGDQRARRCGAQGPQPVDPNTAIYPREEGRSAPPAVGQPAPEIEVEAFNGNKIRLGGLQGKVVLLYFWATWCSPCLADTPKFKAFIEGCRGKDGLFEAISLSLDEDAHWAKRHAQRNGLDWPQAWVGTNSPACSG